jgi:ABC-type glycerol-3-phosphate transport system substrate-binding protein
MEQGDAVQTSLQMVFDTSFNNPSDSKVPGKIVVAGMPKQVKRATILGMWTQAVAANSSNKAEALQFIEYLARLDVATEMAVAGWTGAPQPAIYRTRNAPAFFTVLGEVLKYAQPPPLFPQGNQWFVITGTALQAALSGKQTVKRAMDEAASNVRALLA